MTSKFIYLLLLIATIFSSCNQAETSRYVEDFNFDWKFSLSNDIGAASVKFDDAKWDDVRLPHDWSQALPYDSINGQGCTGYVLGGIGWYRKEFLAPSTTDKIVYLHFDGIYNHSEVWVNGTSVSTHVSGYSPFYVDITKQLTTDGSANVVAVKVDRTRYIDSRWYSGSGIYRNVELVVANKLHIPIWGTFVSTPEVSRVSAQVKVDIDIQNGYDANQNFDIVTEIFSPLGVLVGESLVGSELIAKGAKKTTQLITIAHPELWDITKPQLYHAVTSIRQGEVVVDQVKTTFGIRDINFNEKNGFSLNGKKVKIKGLCIHADGGLVGVAVPKGVWRRRLQTLKDGGCNALRIAHHPASDELLELCDEMGILVQDEFFDEWNYPKDKRLNMNERHDDYASRGYADFFEDNAEKDLKNALIAHRNHPSVFQWSIGNEIEWTYPRNSKATGFFDNMSWDGNYFWSQPPYSPERIKEEYENQAAVEYSIGETAKQLAAWTRELDTSRPVIANCILPSVSFETGYTDALDIVGFSYRRVMFDYALANYPNKPIMATESLPQFHEWKAVDERDFVSGLFLWTGVDYLGEATNQWPYRGTRSGLIDVAGFKKPSYHMYKSLWCDETTLHICTQVLEKTKYKVDANGNVVEKKEGDWKHALWFWPDLNEHWNYAKGQDIVVEVLSNAKKVELFLDGKSLGVKSLNEFQDHIYKWLVPYSKGTLTAKADGQSISVSTATQLTTIVLELDKKEFHNDGYDVVHVELALQDADGNPVMTDDREIQFEVSGDAKVLGVDNGSLANPYPYAGTKVKTHKGKALLIIQSLKGGEGKVSVKASTVGLDNTVVNCQLEERN